MNATIIGASLLLTSLLPLGLWWHASRHGSGAAIAKLVAQTKVRHGRGGKLTLADKQALGTTTKSQGKKRRRIQPMEIVGWEWLRPLTRTLMAAGLPGAPLLLLLVELGLSVGTYAMVGGFYAWCPPAVFVAAVAWGWHQMLVVILSWLSARRLEPSKRQLPPFFDSLARAVRTNAIINVALSEAVDDLEGELRIEMQDALSRIAAGIEQTPEALRGVAERTGCEELAQLAIAVSLHHSGEARLEPPLEELSRAVRASFDLREMARTKMSEVKLQALILSSLPPAMTAMMTAVNPGHMAVFWDDPTGRMLFGGALLSLVAGIVAMVRLSHVKV